MTGTGFHIVDKPSEGLPGSLQTNPRLSRWLRFHADGTVDLTSTTSQGRQLVYWAHFPDPSVLHSIKIVTGTGWATVDGVVLLR